MFGILEHLRYLKTLKHIILLISTGSLEKADLSSKVKKAEKMLYSESMEKKWNKYHLWNI